MNVIIGNYNEDYYEPSCDFHSENRRFLSCTNIKNTRAKNKEYYRKID